MAKERELFENMPNLSDSEKVSIHQILEKVIFEKLDLSEVEGVKNLAEQIKVLSKHLKAKSEMIFEITDVAVILMCMKSVRVHTTVYQMSILSEKKGNWERDIIESYVYVSQLVTIYAKFMVSDYPMTDYLT
jgi:hypothetical protein